MKAAAQLRLRARLLCQTAQGEEIAMGPGKAELLAAIADCGSISAAARQMGMSYRRAWLLVDTMNRCFKSPLVLAATGGVQGGGAHLSPLGAEVLALFQQLEADIQAAAQPSAGALKKLLAKL